MNTFTLFLILSAYLASVSAQLLNEPIALASSRLGVSSSFRRGNGFATTNKDVVATSYEGNLHIIRTNELLNNDTSNTLIYHPPPIDSAFETICSSSPILFESNQSSFVIYAVSDRHTTIENVTSRILAVSLIDASLRWQVTVPGVVIGSPQLNSNTSRIYVVHNVFDTDNGEFEGRISVISFSRERGVVIATLPDESTGAPFGPPKLKTVSWQLGSNGNRNDDDTVDSSAPVALRDVIFFGESRQSGFSTRGNLYALIEMISTTSPTYNLVLASDFPGSGITSPAVTSTLDVYLGTQGSYLSGYTSGRGFASLLESIDNLRENTMTVIASEDLIVYPRWIVPLSSNVSNQAAPIAANSLLSPDEQFLYVAAAGNSIVCIGTGQESANEIWSYDTQSTHLATPVYQEVENSRNVVYFIERVNGIIRQFDAENGILNWETTLGNDVEADFVLADGGLLYYGDTGGRIVALKVAAFETLAPSPAPSMKISQRPTSVPSMLLTNQSQSIDVPSKTPTNNPTAAQTSLRGNTSPQSDSRPAGIISKTNSPTTTNAINAPASTNAEVSAVENENESGKKSKLPLYLGVACGGMALLSVLAFFVLRRGRSQKRNFSSKENEKSRETDKSIESDLAAADLTAGDKESENRSELKEQSGVPTVSSAFVDPSPDDINATFKPSCIPVAKSSKVRRVEFDEVPSKEHENESTEADTPATPRTTSTDNVFRNLPHKDAVDQSISSYSSNEATKPVFTLSACDTLEPIRETSSNPSRDSDDPALEETGGTARPCAPSHHSRESSLSLFSSRDEEEMEGFSNFMEDYSTDPVSPSNVVETSQQQHHDLPIVQKLPVNLLPDRCESPASSDTNSVDESLYLDEGAISEADIGAGSAAFENLGETTKKEQRYTNGLDYADDPPSVLRPGSHYIERHSQKTVDGFQSSYVNGSRSSLVTDKTKPIYKGVSVRPSRSKAGIFSRRIPGKSMPEEETSSEEVQALSQTDNSVVAENKFSVPHVNPAPTSYYVEENEVSQRNKPTMMSTKQEPQSAWNTFLNDLLVAENQFFSPVPPSKSPDGADLQAVRPKRSGHSGKATSKSPRVSNAYDSDSSSEHETPPPPRTFYA